jgi:hypothetical protein
MDCHLGRNKFLMRPVLAPVVGEFVPAEVSTLFDMRPPARFALPKSFQKHILLAENFACEGGAASGYGRA